MGNNTRRAIFMPIESCLLIAISGRSGSGKTTLAYDLGRELKGKSVAFGNYVRELAASHGIGHSIAELQELGQSEFIKGADRFVAEFLDWAGDLEEVLIVEGVRHKAVLDELRKTADETGREFVHVHISVSGSVRALRRTDGDTRALREIDEHSVEADVDGAF